MILREITDFLKETPPFSMLTPDQVIRIARTVSVEFYPGTMR